MENSVNQSYVMLVYISSRPKFRLRSDDLTNKAFSLSLLQAGLVTATCGAFFNFPGVSGDFARAD